jgi:hypothetical protein
MIVAVGEEFFTRASRTSPSISRFTSSKCLICARRNIGFSANNQRRFDEGTIRTFRSFEPCESFHKTLAVKLLLDKSLIRDELWTDETFCLLPRGWISQQFQMPDLRAGTLDSLLTISDDLTKVRYVRFAAAKRRHQISTTV